MKVITGSRKHHYVVKGSVFLIVAILVWAMIGCTDEVLNGDEYKLMISSTPGGSVVVPREGASTRIKGEKVGLIARPDEGYRFVNWIGDVDKIADANDATTTITMKADYSITAEFEMTPVYHLTVSATDGGSVIKPKESTSTYKEEKVNKPVVVDLEAHEDVNYGFVNWTGNVSTVANVNAAVTTITMDGNYSIRANFEKEEAVNITDIHLEAAIKAATRISDRPIYPSDLKRLISLEAEAKNVSDLAALEHCTGLITLKLRGNQIDDISAVANLTSLRKLDVSANRIDDISPVANLTSLTELYLSSNRIDDISAVANLTSLRKLHLSANRIDDISAVANLTSLTELYLSSNLIDDISAVANLTSLAELYFSVNRISDISPLASLSRLRDLSVGGNQIDDISPLTDLSNLTLLNLSNNQISDIEPLVENPGLSEGDKIYLYNNPLSYSPLTQDYVSTYIAQLGARGVIVEY